MNSSVPHLTDSAPQPLLAEIVDYVLARQADEHTIEHAYQCLLEMLSVGFTALQNLRCAQLLGAILPQAHTPGGARVPGTSYELHPASAAFVIGAIGEWADGPVPASTYSSATTSGVLAVADYRSRRAMLRGQQAPTMREVFTAMIASHKIQARLEGVKKSDQVEIGYAIPAHVASAAMTVAMMGGTREQVLGAMSSVSVDATACTPRSQVAIAREAVSNGVCQALLLMNDEVSSKASVPQDSSGLIEGGFLRAPLPMDMSASTRHRFENSVKAYFAPKQAECITALVGDRAKVERMSVCGFVAAMVKN